VFGIVCLSSHFCGGRGEGAYSLAFGNYRSVLWVLRYLFELVALWKFEIRHYDERAGISWEVSDVLWLVIRYIHTTGSEVQALPPLLHAWPKAGMGHIAFSRYVGEQR
jgi:hypothetical protein